MCRVERGFCCPDRFNHQGKDWPEWINLKQGGEFSKRKKIKRKKTGELTREGETQVDCLITVLFHREKHRSQFSSQDGVTRKGKALTTGGKS